MPFFLKYLLILCCCLPLCLLGQNKTVKMEIINEEEGMRSNLVRDVIIDSGGSIWMATANGLHRYDGFSFSIYDNRADSPTPLVSNNIFSVAEDNKGDIWIGTDNGISVLNPATQSVRNYYNNGNKEYPPGTGKVNATKLAKDKNGAIWFLEGGLLGKYSDTLGLQFPYLKELSLLNEINIDINDRIYLNTIGRKESFILDENRKLWNPSHKYPTGDGELLSPIGPIRFKNEDGQLYFLHPGLNICRYDLETDSLETVPIEENSITYVVVKILTRKLNLINSSINEKYEEDAYKVFKVIKAQRNLFFIATNIGLLKVTILDSAFSFEEALNMASLRGFYEHDNGDIYIGGYHPFSFLKYDSKKRALRNIEGVTNIWGINRLNKDTLLLTNDGRSKLSYFNVARQKIEYSVFVSGLPDIRATVVLSNGQVIFGSEKKGLITSSKSNISDLRKFNFKNSDPLLETLKVYSLYQRSDSVFWVGTVNQIVEIDLKKEKATVHDIFDLDKDREVSRGIYDFYENADGNFWLATTNGLVYYDLSTKKSKFYFTTDGLSDNLVYSVKPQDSTALWLSTNNGLTKFNIPQQKFYIYTKNDGVRNQEFNRNASLKTRDGRIFFGGLNGFSSFYPEELKECDEKFKAFISSYSIYDRTKDKLVEYVPERGDGQTIYLDPDNRNVTFKLALTDYRNAKKANFEVMLQGFDKDWITIRNSNEIRYTNLDKGNYIFNVRATNAYGQTSLEEDYVRLVVVRPWYTSAWFFGLLALLVLGAIVGIYLSQINYERKTNSLRNRIANDLHDEVSNTLNNIRIVAMDTRREDRTANAEDINKIEDMCSYAIEHLEDVIWAIEMENQDIKYLIFRMQDNIDSLLRDRQVPVELKKIGLNEEIKLNFLYRRNLLLIFKEALSNIVKHSKSKKVAITIGNIDGRFHLSIKNYIEERLEAPFKTGRGTISMTQRAMALKGELEIKDSGEAYEVLLVLDRALV